MPVKFTWRKLIEQALIESRLVGVGQPITAADFQRGEDLLDLMLDEWDGSPLSLPPFDTQISFNTVSGQSKYVLGPDSNPPSSDASPADVIRPEIILTCTVDLGGGVEIPVVEYPGGFANYQLASVKGTSSQPVYYALNSLWPQSNLHFYPTPDKVYPVQLTCKVKWANTQTGTTQVGDPSDNPYNNAQIPSGYASAVMHNLALRIAERYTEPTAYLINNASNGRFQIMSENYHQLKPDVTRNPMGTFPWVIGDAGVNPPW